MSFLQKLRSFFSRYPKKIRTAPKPDLPLSVFDYLKQIPKAEIHVHFEGSLSASTILALAQKYQVDEIQNENDAKWCLIFRDPYEFFHRLLFVSSLMREPDDFRMAANDIGKRYFNENIQYAEITFAPHKFIRAGVDYLEMMHAIDEGLSAGSNGICLFRFIIDVVRDLGPDIGMEMIKIVEQNPLPKVIAVGLGGGEQYVPELFVDIFRYAESLDLKKTAHAGEGRGPLSVWGALRSLGVKRIDHGVRSREDPKLIDYLSQNQIALNLCPTSNTMLGVVASMESHPIREYYEQGIPVNVSTDDPTFFRTTLTEELGNLITYQGFQIDEIPKVVGNSLRASFLPEDEKTEWINQFSQQSQELQQRLEPALES